MKNYSDLVNKVCDDLKDCLFNSINKHSKHDKVPAELFYMILGAFTGEALVNVYKFQGMNKEKMDNYTVEFCEILKNGIIQFSQQETLQ